MDKNIVLTGVLRYTETRERFHNGTEKQRESIFAFTLFFKIRVSKACSCLFAFVFPLWRHFRLQDNACVRGEGQGAVCKRIVPDGGKHAVFSF